MSFSDEAARPPDGNLSISRRGFLGGTGAAAAAQFVAPLAASVTSYSAQAETLRRPHIVYIITDDQGWRDVGFHGSDIKTPNLDSLAATGVQFDQFYAQPMCTPTRAALMTGRYPFRYGLQTAVIPSGGLYGLALDEWLLPQALKEAGYRTAMVGKWHIGHAKREYWPRQRGFDSFYGALVGEIDHFKHESHGVTDWYRDNEVLHEQGYDSTLFGAEAVRVIEGHDASQPMFLSLAFTAPHTPYQAPQEYLDRYSHIADKNRRAYAAQITAMDDEVGKVLAALEKRGMRKDTLIVFHSDNGGTRSAMFAGESAVKGDLPPDNGPYRDGKGTLYEGGTRVCAAMNWQGVIPQGSVKGMVHIVDMYPTLAKLAGAKLGKNKPLDGLDVWSHIMQKAPSPRSEIVYNVEPMRAGVRNGDWKLIWVSLIPGRMELYDLASDPSEKNDLASKHPERVAELRERATALAREMQQPLIFGDIIRATLDAPPSTPNESLLDMLDAE
jgi:arylsulfatase A-like enzyme